MGKKKNLWKCSAALNITGEKTMLSATKQVEAKTAFSFISACRQTRINQRINQEKALIMIGYQPRQCVQPRVYCHITGCGIEEWIMTWWNIDEISKGVKHVFFVTIADADRWIIPLNPFGHVL